MPLVSFQPCSQMGILFVLEQLIVFTLYLHLLGFLVEGEVSDLFENAADRGLVFPDQFGVLFLLAL